MLTIVLAAAAADFTFYHRNPHQFVARFQACFVDPHCTIQYLHEGKTGGTFLESVMIALTKDTKLQYESCCGPTVVDRFRRFKHDKCAAAFSTYQIDSAPFRDIVVPTCQALTRKVVALITYRDPVSRLVSWVHQTCNKHLNGRSPSVKAACARCDYDATPPFYHDFVARIEQSMRIGAFTAPTLVIDTADLTAFVAALRPPTAHPLKANIERNDLCDFKLPSRLLRRLQPALALYRSLTTGNTTYQT